MLKFIGFKSKSVNAILGTALLLFPLVSHSDPTKRPAQGSESGGGGAQIESAFRLRAYSLINKLALSPRAEALCSSQTMQDGLESSRIRLVDQLVDPVTHQPITDHDLDAWTIPGDMQLMKDSWDHFLNSPDTPAHGKSIDVLILHEVYRSTGKCNDENFKISDHVLALVNAPHKYSRIFRLTFPTRVFNVYGDHGEYSSDLAICDHKPNQIRELITCLSASVIRNYEHGDEKGKTEYIHISTVPYVEFNKDGQQGYENDTTVPAVNYLFGAQLIDQSPEVGRMLGLASPENPFYFIVDMQTGAISYGYDLDSLIQVKNPK